MIPAEYKSPEGKDRRKADPIVDRVAELLQEIKREINEALEDHEKTIDIRFKHLDALVGQLRDGQKEAQKNLIESVERIVNLHNENVKTLVEHQDEKIQAVKNSVDEHAENDAIVVAEINETLEKHAERLAALENKDDKKAAGKWNDIKGYIWGGILGLFGIGIFDWLSGVIQRMGK